MWRILKEYQGYKIIPFNCETKYYAKGMEVLKLRNWAWVFDLLEYGNLSYP